MLGLGSSITTKSGVYTTGGGGGGAVTYIAANTFSLSEDNSTGSVLSVVSSQADDNYVTKTDVVKIVAGRDLTSSDNVAAVTSSGISDLTDGSTVNITFSVYYPSANTGDSTSSASLGYVGGSSNASKLTGANSNLGEWNTFTGTVTVGSSNNNLTVFVDDAGAGAMKNNDEFYLAEVRVY
tara:strand:+ start:254 stop:796 length:543 start_codon:yes stop_codon:yes gene_type:complete